MRKPAKSAADRALLKWFSSECDEVWRNKALLLRPVVFIGEKPLLVSPGQPAEVAGRGAAALALPPLETAFAPPSEEARLALPVSLSEASQEPFGLLYAPGRWEFVAHRTMLGQPSAAVCRLQWANAPRRPASTRNGDTFADASRDWALLEPYQDAFALPVARGEAWLCLLQYGDSASGMLLLLTHEQAVARCFVPELGSAVVPLPAVLGDPPSSLSALEDDALAAHIRALFASAGGGPARGWLLLVRIAGSESVPLDAARALSSWVPAEAAHLMLRMRNGLLVIQEAPEPDSPQWRREAEAVLCDREFLAGCLEIADRAGVTALVERLALWDEDARVTFAALPYWSGTEASEWLLDMRSALALRGEGGWWLDARWSQL